MGAFPEYENTLRDCVRNSPDNFYLHYSLARHLRKKRKSKEALEFLRRSFELNPLYANAVRDGIEMMEEKAQLKQAALVANDFFAAFKRSRRFICPNCRHRYLSITWRCAECGAWAVFEIRYELPAP
jgi:lipopolysaccharide biosynthesis regulator YciM